MKLEPTAPCPCQSENTFGECCGPVLADPRVAETAERLMRSRYTANFIGDDEHLYRTWHPRTRPKEIKAHNNAWRGLKILNVVDGQPGDNTGEVEFQATYSDYRVRVHHERSLFQWRASRWLYVEPIEDLSPPRWNNMKA